MAAGTGDSPGTGTPGYWHKAKNWTDAGLHEDAVWVGGVRYDAIDAIALIKMPVKGDKRLTMFPALVAAHLNRSIGNEDDCIIATLVAADIWMSENPLNLQNLENKVKANSPAWKVGEPLYWRLDAYNNGELCAPSRG